MPKRRLYQEVAGENNESSPSSTSSIQGRGQQQQDLAGRPHHSHRSSSQRRSSNPSVLLILSDACNKHAAYHQSRKSPIRADADEENLPEKCQKDLQSLRELLPKVEKSFQPPSPGKRGPEASDVAHLCDFYTSILRGNYCPHAPHLLCWGKDPEEGKGHFQYVPNVPYAQKVLFYTRSQQMISFFLPNIK